MQAPLQARNDADAAKTDTARTVAQKRVLADNRPEAVAQRKLAEMMNNSPRVLQQQALSDAIQNSPRMVAQRHQMNVLFGGEVKPQGDGAVPAEASLACQLHCTEGPIMAEFASNEKSAVPSTEGARSRKGISLQDNRHAVQRAVNTGTVPGEGTGAAQLADHRGGQVAQRNNTGLPDGLKNGIESLSGMSMDHVKVHYNSSAPAQLNAHAYAQGSDIHVAPGQEKHVPHEAWHVVQQAQGRVKPNGKVGGAAMNDERSLEHEADVFAARALAQGTAQTRTAGDPSRGPFPSTVDKPLQRARSTSSLGTGAVPVQLKTKIVHTYGTAEYEGVSGPVGLEMQAYLDPEDIVVGTETDAAGDGDSAALYAKVALENPKTYARGHLLNHDLGGYGVNENLYPISAGANARHSLIVEQNVKRALVEADAFNKIDKSGMRHGVFYEVKVLGTPVSSQFDCSWRTQSIGETPDPSLNKATAHTAVIASKLKAGDKYFPAGRTIGLEAWSHGKRKGLSDLGNLKYKRTGTKADVQNLSDQQIIHFGPHQIHAPLTDEKHVTVMTSEQVAAQFAWAKANPTELSEDELALWAAHDERFALEEAAHQQRLAAPERVTRSAAGHAQEDAMMAGNE